MKVINKIRAFFTMKGKQEQMDLASAEIRRTGVYLHPTEDLGHTYFVKTDEVDIIIKPGAEITEEDIFVRSNAMNTAPEDPVCEITSEEQMPPEPVSPHEDSTHDEGANEEEHHFKHVHIHTSESEPAENQNSNKPKKKSFTVMLYPDEHEKLVRFIKENGYKKVEYILACIESAKKTSMEANYKRFTEERERRRKAEAQEAKRAREEEMKAQEV